MPPAARTGTRAAGMPACRQPTTIKKTIMIRRLTMLIAALAVMAGAAAANKYDNTDTIVVARDGTGEFRTIGEAVEVCRAFMDYTKVIYVKRGLYKEKLTVPHWLTNIEIVGEDRDETIITYDDHANIRMPETGRPMGTFRTFTVRVQGSGITFKNITIENNAAQIGQAVALHTEGDRLTFVNCRLLGNQDTIYTGNGGTRLFFKDCLIEGTTDFIFGPSTAWFENCDIHSRRNSYITAASTPKDVKYGYVFNHCRLTADEGVNKVYLGRPWRDYGYTLFMNCEMGAHIRPEGWHHWEKQREQTARYLEYNNSGPGANTDSRAAWSRRLSKKEAEGITMQAVFTIDDTWNPEAAKK